MPSADLDPPLFRPFRFGAATLRNRIVMAPMTRRRSPGGAPGPDVAAYYRRRAEGGAGLVVSEGTSIDHPAAQGYADVPDFFGLAALDGWRAVLAGVHEAGAAMIPQLWHVGAVRRPGVGRDPAIPGIGPAAIEENGATLVAEMTTADAAALAASYARAAAHARALGFDGVAVHGAHGYLLDQFVWDVSNPRADAYGGSLERRCALAAEVVAAMRAAVGPDFPIVFRFSQWKAHDYDARIARTPEELGLILSVLVAAGVDVFDVSTRRFWLPAFDGDPRSLAAWTRALSGKPVIAVGSVGLDQPHQSKHYRAAADIGAKFAPLDRVIEGLEREEFDLVAVGRAILADPDWPRKVREGRTGDIAPFRREALEAYE